MKKNMVLMVMICCVAFSLLGCNNADQIAKNDGDINLGGMEVENGVEQTTPTTTTDAQQTNPDSQELSTPTYATSSEYEVQSLVSLNVRDIPTTSGKIVGVVNTNESLPYIATVDNWHKVLYLGSIAYVSAKSNYSRLKSMIADNDIIEKVIAVGMSVLGTPYEFGSTRIIDYNFNKIDSFTGATFDCSAFVQYSFYIGAKINLYGDSRSMSKQGTTVRYNNIKRGDVIFMTSTARQYNTGLEKIGHVGIYLGDNKLLHTYGTGGVRITDFNSFWRGRFISAKSMIL
ncbi:MAG TPA: SH3 domain-containing C40 family peptidase [Clostridia bacterium]|nr:SH3 domain-containing C40 family peptidase [Clostridia bacterium]